MTINGIEFAFSALNANDIDRMQQAQRQADAESSAEKQRVEQQHITDIAQIVRGQCRIVMHFLDNMLGDGASQALGLDGSDFGECRRVLEAFYKAWMAEQAALSDPFGTPGNAVHWPDSVQPQNRSQRRKHKRRRS